MQKTNQNLCPNCKAVFKSKRGLDRHRTRKTPCVASAKDNDDWVCNFCQKVLSRKDNLQRHESKCKAKYSAENDTLQEPAINDASVSTVNIDGTSNATNITDASITNNTSHVNKVINNIDNTGAISTVTNVTNNVTNVTNNIIMLNDYNKPNVNHLYARNALSGNTLISDILHKTGPKILPSLVEPIWFHSAAPENASMYMPSFSSEQVHVFESKQWKEQPIGTVMRTLFDITLNVFTEACDRGYIVKLDEPTKQKVVEELSLAAAKKTFGTHGYIATEALVLGGQAVVKNALDQQAERMRQANIAMNPLPSNQ